MPVVVVGFNLKMVKNMNIRVFMALIIIVFVTGCIHHKVDTNEMVADMKKFKRSNHSHINILWYEGSDNKYDYFGYVYAMFGGKNFKILKDQLIIDGRYRYNKKDVSYCAISEIEDLWFASRFNSNEGTWLPELEGAVIKMKQTALK